MENLLPYFERELVYLRRLRREFSDRYPKVGSRLQLGEENCPDPHVEHTFQSVALIAARIAKRLDDAYPEFTEALFEALFPHYLRPFPSCAIVRAACPPIKSTGAAAVFTIPRGSEVDTVAVDGVRCRFRTTYDVVLAPIRLSAARFEAAIRPPAAMAMHPAASASLSIVVEGAVRTGLKTLRVFIDGEPSFCAALRDALFMRAVQAYVEVGKARWMALPSVPLAPVGFADDDELLPFGARSHASYRVLSEYFVFPEKFNFVDIDLAALQTHLPETCQRFTLHLALAGLPPDSNMARMLGSLSAANLLLGCSPAVNLFQRPGQPISVTHRTADYGVLADATHPAAFEVYSIDAVRMVRRREQKEIVTDFRPFYSLRHGEDSTQKGYYWMLRNDPALALVSPGNEKSITLIDSDFNPLAIEKNSLSIELTCTNRNLPSLLRYGQAGGELTPLRDADSYTVRFLRRPSQAYRYSASFGMHWRLISHLTLNHHSLAQAGLPAFREMLTLYDLPQSPTTRRQIDGIVALEHAATAIWMRHKYGSSLVHGIEVGMTLDEEAYVGSGLHLFVQVIDQFLGQYVQMNSFIELLVLSQQSGKELIRCKPRSGSVNLV
ncbi:type VI secretion system baseplate subunit TssF [Rugamonas sp. CCM 8940]|uniref:type VI secretion system baseplate subunit TssF n=1 Tax=Rugamonas sp. CCM 8940 TaxID=2765359 RepID=UPI0018F5DF3D|nr:type VI secretion system baseplate subunit TssF [Rugamonas sp. CCM 8940]MBJ7308831.1 type VI secretion system baseplate subunit TssF [Rugamonas sp. CCM 8940]